MCFLFCLIGIENAVMAQPQEEFPVRLFPKNLGFNFGIREIVKDAEDFIWLRFELSLQRFDGQKTDLYFQGETVYALIKDSTNNIWVSVSSGIYRFDYGSQNFTLITETRPAHIPERKLLFTSDDNLYYASFKGLFWYNKTTDQFEFYDSFPNTFMHHNYFANEHFSNSQNTLFIRSGDTLYSYHIISKEKKAIKLPLIRTVSALSETSVIVSNWENKSWYVDFASNKKIPLTINDTDRFFIVFDVLRKNEIEYYLATYSGLYLFDTNSFVLKDVSLSYSGEKIIQKRYNALFNDDYNRIWIAGENNLMYFYNNENYFHFIQNNAPSTRMPFGEVRAFVETSEGDYWIATSKGLTFWDTQKNWFTTLQASDGAGDRLNHASLRGLVYDGTYLIIGQTNKGIWLYQPESDLFKRPVYELSEEGNRVRKKIERDFINQIYTLQNGHHIVSARDGVYLLDGTTYQLSELLLPENIKETRFAYQDKNANIFLGTNRGLYILDTTYQIKHRLDSVFQSPKILSFLEYGDTYYVGTTQGLYCLEFKNQKWVVATVETELNNLWISILFSDDLHRIWIVAFDKIYNYTPEKRELTRYNEADNILGNPYVSNAILKNNTGWVLLGAANGITYFSPNNIRVENVKLRPKIKYLRLPEKKAEKSLLTSRITKFSYANRNLEAQIVVPYYAHPNDLMFKYRLKKDGIWFETGNQNKLVLWELPPGSYHFQVAASINGRQWFISEETFSFVIKPPFWRSLAFLLALFLLIIFVLYRVIVGFQEKIKIEKTANKFATSFYGKSTVEDILWDLAKNCVHYLGFEDCVVYRCDYSRKKLVQTAAFGPKNPYGRKINNLLEIPFEKGIVGSVARSGIPEIVNDTSKDPRYIQDNQSWASEITVPIWVDNQVFAIMDSEHPRKNFYKKHHLKTLKKIASVCSERISKYLTEENLRAKIARDLHDEMGSTLTSININSKIAATDVEENHKIKKQLLIISTNSLEMMEKMSDLVWVINPMNDNFLKVIEKIREYAAEMLEASEVKLEFQSIEGGEFIKLNPEERKNTYFIAKEAINNAVKYSQANRIVIRFVKTSDTIEMEICDNGIGFQPENINSGNGLKNMKERAAEISAILEIKSDRGTQIHLTLPTQSVWDYN